MRTILPVTLAAVLTGCGPAAVDKAKMQEVKEYLLRVVEAEKVYKKHNETYSLNMEELYSIDDSLETPPAGYTVKGGGGLALAFGFEVQATPTGKGPSFYVNQSGVVRYSTWGSADERSTPVE